MPGEHGEQSEVSGPSNPPETRSISKLPCLQPMTAPPSPEPTPERRRTQPACFLRAAPAMALVGPAAAVGVGKTDGHPRQGGPFEERKKGKVYGLPALGSRPFAQKMPSAWSWPPWRGQRCLEKG